MESYGSSVIDSNGNINTNLLIPERKPISIESIKLGNMIITNRQKVKVVCGLPLEVFKASDLKNRIGWGRPRNRDIEKGDYNIEKGEFSISDIYVSNNVALKENQNWVVALNG